MSAPTRRPPATVDVARVVLVPHAFPPSSWLAVSDCGMVKLYNSRGECITALAPSEARRVARELAEALEQAADTTELRCYGKVMSR